MARVIWHPAYRDYSFGNDHPFSPLRLDMTLDLCAALGHPLETEEPPPATRADLLRVHEEYYVRRVEALSRGEAVDDAEDYGLATPDTPAFRGMDEAGRWLVGGALHGARRIIEGEKRVLQLGGGLHHARRNFASGFCIYNDIAIAIDELTRAGLWVAYIDVDVHHGDGVQQIVYEDRRVMTVSLHESGQYLFPGTGATHELGLGVGRGLKLNFPLQPFTDGGSYLEIFEHFVPTALRQFRPGVLVVQAGADAHFDDQLADLMLTTRDYERIFRKVLDWAAEFTNGRVLFTLGGGYSFRATPRVWTLLSLVLRDLPVPEHLPEPWRARWAGTISGAVPRRFHDPVLPEEMLPDRHEIAQRNRQQALHLLESARPYWF